MSCPAGKKMERAIHRLLTRGLRPHRMRALLEHLTACAPCRASYERAMALERALAGTVGPSRFELERLAPLALEAAHPPHRALSRPGLVRLAALATVLGAALMLLWLSPLRLSPSSQQWGVKGPALARSPQIRPGSPVGVRALVLHRDAQGRLQAQPLGQTPLAPGDQVRFLATNPEDQPRHVVVLAHQGEGWLQVAPPEGSHPLPPGAIDQLIPGALTIDRGFEPPRAQALISPRPLLPQETRRALQGTRGPWIWQTISLSFGGDAP